MLSFWRSLGLSTLMATSFASLAEDTPPETEDEPSIWDGVIAAPQLSNGPKLGFSVGALLGYMHKFDEKSPPSLLATSGKYSNTDSWQASIFGNAFFDEDQQRITLFQMWGQANNEYKDFQGTGQVIDTENQINVTFLRYQHRLPETKWFLGGYWIGVNFNPTGIDQFSQGVLDKLAFTEVDNKGLGLNLLYDGLSNVYNPEDGSKFELFISRYDDVFGSDTEFTAYNAVYSTYFGLAEGHVLALNTQALLTPDAPPSSQGTLRRFRGYTSGEASGEYLWSGQAEYRYELFPRWYLAAFGGVATLVNHNDDLGHSDNWYPMGGFGGRYVLNKESGLMLRLDFAKGKAYNNALYLQVGQPF